MERFGVTVAKGEKVDIFGVLVTATDYEDATRRIIEAAQKRSSYGVSALAVHGLMESVNDDALRAQVNSLDLVTPDGQPVRWAMNAIHGTDLSDRVYGPDLTWRVLEAAAETGIGIYLFGSTPEICDAFTAEIRRRHPTCQIVGVQPDRFRDASPDEDLEDIERINATQAGIVLVGRGCPRQERWVADHLGKIDAAMLAVGAAFDYGAGAMSEPPRWMQAAGLQWLYRLAQEPGRLWKRYLFTNTEFLLRLARARLTR
jgi:exopolysaccharide biosynthesis WecB/TagA/CpsF family protein